MERDFRRLADEFARHGQGHIFSGWDKLDHQGREELLSHCSQVDFAWLEARLAEIRNPSRRTAATLEPAPVQTLPATPEEEKTEAEAKRIGEEKLRQGKVAAFMVAGGQGSRLGHDGPKGCYPIGPVSGRSLFQWHAEQILARGRRHGAAIPWYIMTSEENDKATRDFFQEHACFGLEPGNVFFFRQGMAPTLGLDGKLLLASPSRLARHPDSHGGALQGLAASGALDDMRRRGVEIISYFQVDNPLVKIADPRFLGWHVKSGSEISSKVLAKTSPEEKLGVACLRDGRPAVVEYIDLDPELMNARDAGGRLRFWAGSIAIHLMDVAFAAGFGGARSLTWHASRKKVAYFDGEGPLKPERENAIKFETFVFDAIPLARKTLNLETRRENEFAPVKNAEGVDSAASCREMMLRRFNRWLDSAGLPRPNGRELSLEISPLYSLDAREFAQKAAGGSVTPTDALVLE